MMAAWEQVLQKGFVTGTRELPGPEDGRFRILYFGLANVLPGQHVGAFAPAGWTEDELGLSHDKGTREPALLTPREQEILQLMAEGFSTLAAAERLMVSQATVKSHLGHVYEKLGAAGRAGAVAKAMRLGIIV
jgi:DNA-binding CsgD family transcriptional regulator